MKIIHTADLHLDSKIESLPSDKAKIIREEVISTFERLCDYAIEENVTAVIIAGDMFDTSKISIKTLQRIINSIKKADNIDFLCLSGNHDEKNAFYSIENLPNNLKFINNSWCYYYYDNVCISGISFDNNNIITYQDSLSLNEKNINIVALHGQIIGYKNNDEAEVISLPKLKNKNIDFLSLGHIHQNIIDELDLRGKYGYSGCLIGRGFDEIGDKGFNLIEIENNKLNINFIPFSKIRFFVEQFYIDCCKEIYKQVDEFVNKLSTKYTKNDILKIEIIGDITSEYNLDKTFIEKKLNENFFYAKIVDKTNLKIEEKDYLNDKSIVGEFVRTVLSSDLIKEEKDKIIIQGLNALNNKEI